jgi:hypothetical protein
MNVNILDQPRTKLCDDPNGKAIPRQFWQAAAIETVG